MLYFIRDNAMDSAINMAYRPEEEEEDNRQASCDFRGKWSGSALRTVS